MLLTIDIGNTNVVCAVFDNDNLVESVRIESDLNFWSEFQPLSEHQIDGIVISSVVPYLTKIYSEASKNIFDIFPIVVSVENSGLLYNVDDPSEVGADRICNCVATIENIGSPAIVVDFGTATTYDVIDEKQTFIGGAIAPGIDVSARYLFEKAALLRDTAFTFPEKVVGKNTKTNLQSGIMFSAIDEVEGMVKRIKTEMEWNDVNVVLTGGFGKLVSPKLTIKHSLVPSLTLDGMRLIYFENTSSN
ncbi:MAG: type III pantothenate kinase [Candidatus Marinimicrobia bacterium]|nr:type III pantothenate kinase [Candidatus Neomarinimicrobiota bacterium]MBL7022958.1 type III pantothenate kinase [Candidatus Neomarinimicrobiota bacterium]MBL7108776.1 type III pantothenate kinase [Candidatus Neomarinimicrobiota bacterium]